MEQVGNGSKLWPGDLASIAVGYGLKAVHVQTVIDVETSGKGFDALGWVEFLFEPHLYYRNVSGDELLVAEAGGFAYPKWRGPGSYPKTLQLRHDQFTKAYDLNATAALKSASWGLGQILGSECEEAGYKTPQEMITAFAKSEANQVRGMLNLIKGRGLDKDLLGFPNMANCRHFALRYNGAAYEHNNYHVKLQQTYLKLLQSQRGQDTLSPMLSQPPVSQPSVVPAAMPDVLKLGDKDQDIYGPVHNLQQALYDLGYVVDVDGDFGPQTREAVLAWKGNSGLDTSPDLSSQDMEQLQASIRRRS